MSMMKTGFALASAMYFACLASAATIQIEVGTQVVSGWNTLGGSVTTDKTSDLPNLLDSTGASSGISLTKDDTHFFSLAGINSGGTTTPVSPASSLFPSAVTRDNWFGVDVAFGGYTIPRPKASWTFGNLDSNMKYTFHFFASRTGVTDNRETKYALDGQASDSVLLNPTANTSQYVTIADMLPDSSNNIVLTVTKGPNNNNASGFYHLSAIVIESTAIPEPASLGLLGIGGLMMVRRRR